MAEPFSNLNDFAANFSQYIVRPLNSFGLGGFVFDIEGETTVNLTADITDHFVEDGTSIQDHISIKPKKVILKSYVGELVDRQDESTDTFVQKAVQKLTTLNQFLPTMTDMAQQVLDIRDADLTLNSITDKLSSKTINRVTDYWSFIKNMAGGMESRQQMAYMYFKALYEQKMLVSVQTPFEFMNRMAIESVTSIQSENTKYMSDFTITLKEIRTAELLATPKRKYTTEVGGQTVSEPFQGRSVLQNSNDINLGNITGLDTLDVPVERINIGIDRPISIGDLPTFNPDTPLVYDLPSAAIDALPRVQLDGVGEFQ